MSELDIFFLYLSIYGFWPILFAFVGVCAAWAIYEVFLTPKEAREIRRASRKKRPIAIHAGDDGYIHVESLDIVGLEGYAKTKKNVKDSWTAFFPRKSGEGFSVEGEDETNESKIARFLNELSSKKYYLQHARIPVWVGYTGKSILTSIASLVGLEGLEKALVGNPHPNPVVLDLQKIKSLFDKPWDQSQVRASEVDAKTEGELTAKKFAGLEGWKVIIIPLVLILAIVVLAIVGMWVFT